MGPTHRNNNDEEKKRERKKLWNTSINLNWKPRDWTSALAQMMDSWFGIIFWAIENGKPQNVTNEDKKKRNNLLVLFCS